MKLEPVSHPDIRRIVSRLHVSASPLAVVRVVKRNLQWRKTDKAGRRYAIAAAIQAHAHNKLEYRAVVSGQLSLLDRWKPRYFFDRSSKTTVICP